VIYADNAATTRISDRAFEQMLPFLREQYGNASSQYSLGVKAKRAIEKARQQVAIAICSEPSEIYFTSGGSECNSWVLRSVAESFNNENVHMITSAVEHHSVLNACHELETKGVQLTYLPVDSCGRVSVDILKAKIRPNTKLISIMLANNEIGTIQPVAGIRQTLHERNILFHTDAIQAVRNVSMAMRHFHKEFSVAMEHYFLVPVY